MVAELRSAMEEMEAKMKEMDKRTQELEVTHALQNTKIDDVQKKWTSWIR